ncbi:MAG: RpiB/LacA/LacB family sugar-phosphate isomerase [Gemmataceae bacterium]|nr:RpiB/LacA/LacB family sugar-phosphate isomerase [Gemmataceae bacterium]
MSQENGEATVWHWTQRVFSSEDLRREYRGQKSLVLPPRGLVTPQAADELKSRGISVSWQVSASGGRKPPDDCTRNAWHYATENPDSLVDAAIQSLARDGLHFVKWKTAAEPIAACAKVLTGLLVGKESAGGVVFCSNPWLMCCVANKVTGVRAATVQNAKEAAQARASTGANFFAVPMPGRTVFEVKSLLKAVVTTTPKCADETTKVFEELDQHARG